MTPSEVAKLLGFSPSMVHKLIEQNKIPYFEISNPLGIRKRRTIRFNRADIEKFIQDRQIKKQTTNP